MRPLNKLCVYDGEEWVDTLRIYEVPCNGMIRYILHHIEDEDMYIFDSVGEALEAAARRVSFSNAPRVGPCP
ncbi:MAG: hypothetical protein ACO2PN_03930 [Pyrobaculum sp.]|jgi:hypothetical protein